jgi:Rieske 2Fe-2S family protein
VNWKVFSDAFCEGYHVGTIHKRSLAGSFISEANPYCHLVGVRIYRHHSIVSIPWGNPKHKPTASELLVRKFSGGSYGTGLDSGFDHLPKGLNPERDPSWNFDIVNIFPNFAVHVGADFAYSYNFWPDAVDRSVATLHVGT